ncbi:MAG: sigma-E processing peptidase SpoIIGA [Oscillospiraceae bacterium]|nr:sigma-E processing peptidase SpoIIGA [Oscillospiraceae bacterium]
MTVYLDVLLLSNLWADYALLLASARLTHTPLSRGRCLLGAAAGAVCSLSVLLPPLPPAVCILLRLGTALAVCLTSFGRKRLLRQTAVFSAVSLFFCGVLYVLSSACRPAGWYMRNTVIYADISLLMLLLGTALASLMTVLWARRSAAGMPDGCRLHLRVGGLDLLLPAIADTGNTLCDAFTGKPVIVCPANALTGWLQRYPDTAAAAASCRGFRMLPVRTVAGTALLPAFQPEYAAVIPENGSAERPADVLIAVTEQMQKTAVIPAAVCK